MQIVAVPLYNKEMVVESYMFRYMKENNLFSSAQATNIFDGASKAQALEILELVGFDTFSSGKPLFIPITDIMLLGNLDKQCHAPSDKIIFVFEDPPKQEDIYLLHIRRLRTLGYRFAVNYPFDVLKPDLVIAECSFVFLSQRAEKSERTQYILHNLKQFYAGLTPIATHIYAEDTLKSLYGKGYGLYESRFYKVPITAGDTKVSPLKLNSIRLINTVQDENFEFESVSQVVRGDPALTISLMRMVNAPGAGRRNKIQTIAQAVAMLGQQEVRKWVTTAVAQSLCGDRPNEITRISLLRAKFAENLAPLFEMSHMSSELFLMGLFSAIDIILEVSMVEALRLILVSDNIRSALVDSGGIFAPVLKMTADYENANWSSVSRHMIIYGIKEDDLSEAYIDALVWYRNLVMQDGVSYEDAIAETNAT